MAITITITIDETSAPGERRVSVSRTAPIAELREFATDDRSADLNARYAELLARHTELVRQMGDEIGDFPAANVDGFLSHFIITIEFNRGPLAGKI